MRLALYARVSTSEQHADAQLDALRAYATRRAVEVAGEYVDHGVSGAKARRPSLDRMMADAKRRRFDAMVCVKLDRLARSVHHLLTLAQEFEALGIDLIVLDQAIDTTTPAGRLMFNVLGSVAEFERDLIRERTKAGVAAAKRRGKTLGRPRALSDDASARLRRMFEAGRSLRHIASVLGVSKATVSREIERQGLRRAA